MPKANELADNEILGTKQHWDEARDYPKIIQAVQANQTDYDAVWVRLMVSASNQGPENSDHE